MIIIVFIHMYTHILHVYRTYVYYIIYYILFHIGSVPRLNDMVYARSYLPRNGSLLVNST